MDDGRETRAALAALFAGLVKALDETTRGVETAFIRHIDEARERLTEAGGATDAVIATLSQTKDLLAAESDPTEPAWIVYPPAPDRDGDLWPESERVQTQTLARAVDLWGRLPSVDRRRAEIQTASGRRYDARHLERLSTLFKDLRDQVGER